MPRLFISHSSQDNVAAIAFKQWLITTGWSREDVFLDLDDIHAAERWKEALHRAHSQCEAVVLLASPAVFSSPECLAEVRKAEDYGMEIIVVLLPDLKFNDSRLDSYKQRQIVDLSAPPQAHLERVSYRGEQYEVRFNENALASVKEFLFKRGIAPDRFAWPPEGRPDAEAFPGLRSFTEDDAAIFFGRDSDILEGLNKLRLLRQNGLPRFMVIQAASGAGKSSYLRAGLWPRLRRNSDFAPVAILRPAGGIVTGPEGLGHKLAARISRPRRPISPGEIHALLRAGDEAVAATEFARLIQTAATQAHEQRRVGDPDAGPPAVILAVDQAEELFGADDKAESERFLSLFAGLMSKPPADVKLFWLFTVRTDSAARLLQMVKDGGLEVPLIFPLLPLQKSSYREVIEKPLELLARRGQRVKLDPRLADELAKASGADALPLIAFTISHLCREFSTTGSLTLTQYNQIGGIAGSIEMALKIALARPGDEPAIPAAQDEQLELLRAVLIPSLARVDPDTGEPIRRVAEVSKFQEAPAAHALVRRLVDKARLLVEDEVSGANVVEIAHESLLRQWPALTAWLQADADHLRRLGNVERAAGEWQRKGCKREDLTHRGKRLAAARALAKEERFKAQLDKSPISRLYLDACRRAQRRRIAIASLTGAALLAAPFVVVEVQELILKHRHAGDVEAARIYKPFARILAAGESANALPDKDERGKPVVFRDCEDCPEMVIIPAGIALVGSPNEDPDKAKDELPQHDVAIPRLAIGEFDVTFDEWAACVRGGRRCQSNPNPSDPDDADKTRGRRPVVNVKWADARDYVEWLRETTGRTYRLLTEAEWEYAARARTHSRYYTGNTIQEWSEANFGNVVGKPEPVGSYPPNEFGLFDMAGNVWQWVQDCYHVNYKDEPSTLFEPDRSASRAGGKPAMKPLTADVAWEDEGGCSLRVLRGGNFYTPAAELRSAHRFQYPPGGLVPHVGFRVAREL